MRKPRSAKPATALWVADNTRRIGLTPADVARRLDVAESTVRGWESGRGISEQYVPDLERIFGVPAPAREEPAADQTALVAAIERQSQAIEKQAQAMTVLARAIERGSTNVLDGVLGQSRLLARLVDALAPEGTPTQDELEPHAGLLR